jgi:hypothetical protein
MAHQSFPTAADFAWEARIQACAVHLPAERWPAWLQRTKTCDRPPVVYVLVQAPSNQRAAAIGPGHRSLYNGASAYLGACAGHAGEAMRTDPGDWRWAKDGTLVADHPDPAGELTLLALGQ